MRIEDILKAKEIRASRQKALLLSESDCSLISFTMNIPGEIKISPIITAAFNEGAELIDAQLSASRIEVLKKELYYPETGCEGFWLLKADAKKVKRKMIETELCSDISRLFDIDVLSHDAVPVSRTELGFPKRQCFLCKNDAHICVRSRAHSIEELKLKVFELLNEHFAQKRAEKAAELACRSMMYEVSVTPKPGLVDRFDNGAHHDMDFFSFINSAAALTPFFKEFYLTGFRYADQPLQQLLPLLRVSGIKAEQQMLKATGGVNTHKGLIFSLGVICGALGWCEANGEGNTSSALLAACSDMVKDDIAAELDVIKSRAPKTGGERLFLSSGNAGIRKEAAEGFPTVRGIALPWLEHYLEKGLSINDAGVYTLLKIVLATEDSNVFSRCGKYGIDKMKHQIENLMLTEEMPSVCDINALNQKWIKDNISPGGCADLLAISFFLHFYFKEKTADTDI